MRRDAVTLGPMSEYRPGPASLHTRLLFERARTELPFCDEQDRDNVVRGRLASFPAAGDGAAPGADRSRADGLVTHPSLLRISELRRVDGVFAVVDGVHQVRGPGHRNLTLVDSEHGRILVDGPEHPDLRRACVALVDRHAGARPLVATLDTRSVPERVTVDGVVVETFPIEDGTASPDLVRWFPDLGFLYSSASLWHSLPPLVVDGHARDPVAWSKSLNRVLAVCRDDLEVVAGAQDWPTWGNGRARMLLSDQRDLLRYLHDEVLRLGHRGHSAEEIVAMFRLPPALAAKWHARGYDSTIESHVLSLHPARRAPVEDPTVHRLPLPITSAARFLNWAGGLREAVHQLQNSYAEGDYDWVARAGELVLAVEPGAEAVRGVTVRAYEQLALQEENIARRRAWSERARLLVGGCPEPSAPQADCVADGDVGQLLDHLAVRLVGHRAAQRDLRLRWRIEDTDVSYLLEVHNGALFATPEGEGRDQASLTTSRATLGALACDHETWRDSVRTGAARPDGDLQALELFFGFLDPWPCPRQVPGGHPSPHHHKEN